MPKYKDQQNNVHHLDDESFAHLLPAGSVQITEEEAELIRNPPQTSEQIAAERWIKIKAKRDDLTDNGGCLVDGKWYHSDAKSKQQQMALAMVGASLPAIPWKTMDGSFVTLTPTIVGQIFQAQMTREQTIFANAETLKADSNADINAGWPARYETAPL